MGITDLPILSMLRERMEWHQERQRVLAENVANADTPNYQAQDLAPPDFSNELSAASMGSVALDRTNPNHIAGNGISDSPFESATDTHYEVQPRGNSVTHEDEMMKVANNQMDFEAVASLYSRSLSLIKLAVGGA